MYKVDEINGQKNWWTLIIWALEVEGESVLQAKCSWLKSTTEKLKNVEGGTDSGGLVSVIHHNARGKTESWVLLRNGRKWEMHSLIMGNWW